MNLTVTQMITVLQRRLHQDNGLTNATEEYRADIEEALATAVNPDLGGATLILNGDAFEGAEMTGLLFQVIALATELLVLDRKAGKDVDLVISADTPMGRVNTTEKPKIRAEEIERKQNRYYDRVNTYLYGLPDGKPEGIDIDEVVMQDRSVPID